MKQKTGENSGKGKTPCVRKKHGVWFRIACIALAAVILLVLIGVGFLVWYYTQDESDRTLSWVKSMIQEYYYEEIDEDVLDAATLDTLFGYNGEEAILDKYSAYYTASQYSALQSERAGNQSGLGISVIAEDDGILIYKVSGNSPAEEGGLCAGMYIYGYGENDIQMVACSATSELTSFLSGYSAGEEFVLYVGEDAETCESYTLAKDTYVQNYVFYADSEYGYRFTGDDADVLTQSESRLTYLPDDTAYIRLDSFAGDAAEQFEGMLDVFSERGKTDLILDLRNDGGGQVSIMDEIAEFLCKDAPSSNFTVMSANYRSGTVSEYKADTNRYSEYFTEDSHISVLANCNTASASEALMGAMIDYGTIGYEDIYLAEIDGTAKTYGKGIMQTTYPNVLTGEAIKLTTAKIYWPNGNSIHDIGILPDDGAVAVTMSGYVEYNDSMLQEIVSTYLS